MGGRGSSFKYNGIVSRINSLEDIGMGSLRTPIQVTSREEGYEVQRLWDSANLSKTELSELPVREVKVSDLYSWQRVVDKYGLLNMVKGDTPHSSDMPIAMSYKGNLVLVDGNHRVALAMLKGKKRLKVRVYPYGG